MNSCMANIDDAIKQIAFTCSFNRSTSLLRHVLAMVMRRVELRQAMRPLLTQCGGSERPYFTAGGGPRELTFSLCSQPVHC